MLSDLGQTRIEAQLLGPTHVRDTWAPFATSCFVYTRKKRGSFLSSRQHRTTKGLSTTVSVAKTWWEAIKRRKDAAMRVDGGAAVLIVEGDAVVLRWSQPSSSPMVLLWVAMEGELDGGEDIVRWHRIGTSCLRSSLSSILTFFSFASRLKSSLSILTLYSPLLLVFYSVFFFPLGFGFGNADRGF